LLPQPPSEYRTNQRIAPECENVIALLGGAFANAKAPPINTLHKKERKGAEKKEKEKQKEKEKEAKRKRKVILFFVISMRKHIEKVVNIRELS